MGSLALGACDEVGLAEPDNKPAGQVVAVAGESEITIHQVNAELRRLNAQAAGDPDAAGRRLLQDIVDRELMAQKALTADLHRRPDVLLELERARSLVLAQAYLREALEPGPPPSDAEVAEFIAANPGLFDERRVFRFEQIVVDRADFADEMVTMVDSAGSFEDVASALTDAGIDHKRSTTVRRAEEFDAEVLERIATVRPGENVVLKGTRQVALMRLVATERLPVTREEAEAAARRLLAVKKARERTDGLREALRAESDVQFFGGFAGLNRNEAGGDPSARPGGPDGGAPGNGAE